MEIPILFQTSMVQAIFGNTKTETRRLTGLDYINEDPEDWHFVGSSDKMDIMHPAESRHPERPWFLWGHNHIDSTFIAQCPYGIPGDILWTRETWRPKGHSFPIGFPYEYKATAEKDGNPVDEPWKPSIHMPKVACRLKLEVKSIRPERLRNITSAGALAEGIKYSDSPIGFCGFDYIFGGYNVMTTPVKSYMSLFKSINGKDLTDKNPWLWVIEFKKL